MVGEDRRLGESMGIVHRLMKEQFWNVFFLVSILGLAAGTINGMIGSIPVLSAFSYPITLIIVTPFTTIWVATVYAKLTSAGAAKGIGAPAAGAGAKAAAIPSNSKTIGPKPTARPAPKAVAPRPLAASVAVRKTAPNRVANRAPPRKK